MYNDIEDFESFKRKLLKAVKDYYGEYYQVSINEVIKLNGVVLHGLNIMEQAVSICPTIYLENYYKRYNEGDNFSELFNEIIEIYERYKSPRFLGLEFFSDYDKVKEKLSVKLINAQMNEHLLEDVPYKLIDDMALVCLVEMRAESGECGSVLIHNNHICMWGIRQERLIDDAINNAQQMNKVYVKKLNELIFELYDRSENSEFGEFEKEELEILEQDQHTMYVLSNTKQINGASVIAYPGVLSSIAKFLNGDYYIIPSSIHELIILPFSISENIADINNMICSVNSQMLDTEEILSDHAYLYEMVSNKLCAVS